MYESGALGDAFKGINPTFLGTAVAIVLQTTKNSILVAAGKITPQQMGAAFVDTLIASSGYFAGAHIGCIIGQALGFELPVVGYLLGSLPGTAFCVFYNVGKINSYLSALTPASPASVSLSRTMSCQKTFLTIWGSKRR